MINEKNLKIYDIADKSNGYRANPLACIHFTEKGTECTNGYMAIRVSYPDVDIDDYPKLEDGLTPEKINGKTLVNAEDAKMVLDIKKRIKIGKAVPILEYVAVQDKGSHLGFGITNLETTNVVRIKKVEGEFPEIEDVMPKGDAERVIHVYPTYLIKLLEHLSPDTAVTIKCYGDSEPLVLEQTLPETGQEVIALLMPMEVPEEPGQEGPADLVHASYLMQAIEEMELLMPC